MNSLLLFLLLVLLSGCVPANKKTESKQLQADIAEMASPQKQVEAAGPEQSTKRINEMLDLQKQIQDINSEVSRLIENHHKEIDKLTSERALLRSKLVELYKIEKKHQGQK
jgi:TolA-binding protein